MSTSGTTGASPTPQSQPIQGGESLAPVERTYVQTVETTKTETDKTVGQVFQQVTDTSNKTSFEAKSDTKPVVDRTNLSLKELPPSDQKTHKLQEKNIDTTNIEERDDKELQAQRDGRTESKKDDWLDLSEESPAPAGSSVNTTATTLQTSTTTKEETSKVESAQSTAAQATRDDGDMGLGQLFQESVGISTTNVAQVAKEEAEAEVNHSSQVSWLKLGSNGVEEVSKTRPVDAEKWIKVNEKTERYVAENHKAMGHRTPAQVEATISDYYKEKGLKDVSGFKLHSTSSHSEEQFRSQMHQQISFCISLNEVTNRVEEYKTPTHYDHALGPKVGTEKIEQKDREKATISGEKSTFTLSGTGSSKDIQEVEEAARKQTHDKLSLEKEKLLKELKAKKHELALEYYKAAKQYYEERSHVAKAA